MDPAEGLARLERMAQRARESREKAQAEARREEAAERAAQICAELADAADRYLAGPPDGCIECYHWERHHAGLSGSWFWTHRPPEEALWWEVYRGEKTDDVLTCWHDCHGPDGYERPIILFA